MFHFLPTFLRIWIDNQFSPYRRAEREALAAGNMQAVHQAREAKTNDLHRRLASEIGREWVA